MNAVDAIVNTVLYEGYMLYPQRPSATPADMARSTMGGLCPQAYCALHGDETSTMHVECLVEGTAATTIELRIGFLHLTERNLQSFDPPIVNWPAKEPISGRDLDVLEIDGERYCAWKEA